MIGSDVLLMASYDRRAAPTVVHQRSEFVYLSRSVMTSLVWSQEVLCCQTSAVRPPVVSWGELLNRAGICVPSVKPGALLLPPAGRPELLLPSPLTCADEEDSWKEGGGRGACSPGHGEAPVLQSLGV